MARVSIILDTRSKNKDNQHPLSLLISHTRKTRTISFKLFLKKDQWNNQTREIINYPNSKRTTAIYRKKLAIASDFLLENQLEVQLMNINELKANIEALIVKSAETSPNHLQRFVAKKTSKISLLGYSGTIIERLRVSNRHGNAKAYDCGVKAVVKFNNGNDIELADITVTFLNDFTAHHLGKSNSKNTISAYLRPIRKMMKDAVKEGVLNAQCRPFENFSIPENRETIKRAIPKEVITKIKGIIVDEIKVEKEQKALHPKEKQALKDAQNYLLFMFNNRGINLIDLAKFTKEQILYSKYENGKLIEGRLFYQRSKSGKNLSVKLTKESLRILNDYNIADKEKGDFVFPIGFTNTKTGRTTYNRKRSRINKRMKRLAELVGYDGNITTYVIRHSWATIAKKSGVEIAVIGESMGHSDVKTTETYLANFDNETLDDANELVVA